jgi:membrane protein DedA with SNARE-associated domain
LDDLRHHHRFRTAVFALAGVLTVASALGSAFSPYLLVKSPLTLVLASPAAPHVVLAAATVAPAPLIIATTLRRALAGVAAYGLGFLYGRAAIEWLETRYPRLGKLVAWVERLFARSGLWLMVLAPAPTLALLAGAGRYSFARVVLALVLGHAWWAVLTYYVGNALTAWTDALTDLIGENLLESTLIAVALVALQQGVSRLTRQRRSAKAG